MNLKRVIFLTPGLLGMSIAMAYADPIKICTGAQSGVYYDAGQSIAKMASGLNVEVIETTGTIDNMNKMLENGECNVMIGQPDGPAFLARQSPAAVKKMRQVATLHREYLHVLCNRDTGPDDLYSLKGRLAIGEPNSGGWLIWQNLTKVDPRLAEIPVTNESGVMALSAVSAGTDASCMLVPAGIGNGTLNEANATFADTIRLVGANSRKYDDVQGIDGKPLYTYSDIPGGTYKNLQSGWISTAVSTISWNAGVFINTDSFRDQKQLQAFVTAVNRAAIGIKAEYGK